MPLEVRVRNSGPTILYRLAKGKLREKGASTLRMGFGKNQITFLASVLQALSNSNCERVPDKHPVFQRR